MEILEGFWKHAGVIPVENEKVWGVGQVVTSLPQDFNASADGDIARIPTMASAKMIIFFIFLLINFSAQGYL
jgi:hypothetical protein